VYEPSSTFLPFRILSSSFARWDTRDVNCCNTPLELTLLSAVDYDASSEIPNPFGIGISFRSPAACQPQKLHIVSIAPVVVRSLKAQANLLHHDESSLTKLYESIMKIYLDFRV
jgi:hypothetical protein